MELNQPKISPVKAIYDYARRNKISAEYQLENESGPAHEKVYTVRLRLGENEYIGNDRSIKLAQRAAAQTAVDENKQILTINNSNQKINKCQSPTVALNAWAAQHHIPIKYFLLNEQHFHPTVDSLWNRPYIIFYYRLHFNNDLYFDGHGFSHQQARINCAYQALEFIEQNPTFSMKSSDPQIQQKSDISLMYERAQRLGLSVRIEHNEPRKITYHIGEEYSTTGDGTTKHQAKQIAAQRMLEILPTVNKKEKCKSKQNQKHNNQHNKFIGQKGLTNYSLSNEINPITRLYQIAQARQIKVEFHQLEFLSNDKLFHFRAQINENDFADGYEKNKQAAKRSAAESLLLKLNPELLGSVTSSTSSLPIKSSLKCEENSNKQREKKHVHFIENEIIDHEKPKTNLQTSIKQQLINACQKLNISIEYDDKTITNENEKYQSILSLSKDDRLLAQFRSHGPSLTRAQENVSLTAWENLRQLFNGSIQIPKTKIKKKISHVEPSITVAQN